MVLLLYKKNRREKMIDFTKCKEEFNNYKGSEKKKTLIYNGKKYLVKFPDPSKEKNVNLSYKNNTVSEYIGSNIFKMAGFKTQNILLGTYIYNEKEKIVCACEDFNNDIESLYEFENLALSSNPDKKIETELSDIMEVLEESKKLVEEAQQAIKALEKDSIPEDLKKTAEKLSQSEKTKELANALEQGDTQQINNQMDKLLSQMENMSQQELEQIAQAMNDMGKELSDEELKELLENLSEQLSKGNLAQANIKGQALKGKLATLSNQNKELIQNMENLNQALASENTTSKTQQSGQSGQLGEGQGQGQDEGEQSGSGQGGSGQGGGEGSNSGQGRGSGHQQTEKIYTRKAE